MNNTVNNGYRQTIEVPKTITFTSKLLQAISAKWAAKYAARLFVTPIKHKTPKREQGMDKNSIQTKAVLPSINKEIVVYKYGSSHKKVILVHGWSGRGTQLVKIADTLLEMGYATISFDAPAHGKTNGKTTNMREFIEAVMYLETQYGPFEIGIGHSLGGMTLLNAIKRGLKLNKMITIGAGNLVEDIALDFTRKIGLKDEIGLKMKNGFDKQLGEDINMLSASIAANDVHVPVLLLHDENDMDVPLSSAKNIHKNLSNSKLIITKGLGHRKILGAQMVLDSIKDFIR